MQDKLSELEKQVEEFKDPLNKTEGKFKIALLRALIDLDKRLINVEAYVDEKRRHG